MTTLNLDTAMFVDVLVDVKRRCAVGLWGKVSSSLIHSTHVLHVRSYIIVSIIIVIAAAADFVLMAAGVFLVLL